MEATSNFADKRTDEAKDEAKKTEKGREEVWNCTPNLEIHRHVETKERVKVDRIGEILRKEDARIGHAVELLANPAKLNESVGTWVYVVPGELRLEEGHYDIERKRLADGRIELHLTSGMTLKEFNELRPGRSGLSVTGQVEATMRDSHPFEIMSKEGGKIYTIEYMGADHSDLSYVRRIDGPLPIRVLLKEDGSESHRGRRRPSNAKA
jgi:hypothetical protein